MLSFRKALPILGLLASATVAQATPVVVDADHFSVTYDDAFVGPYDQGLLSGSLDTVYFQPSALFALSGGSPASTSAALQLTIAIDPGYTFAGLTFTERGDYFLIGGAVVDVAAAVEAVNADTSASALLSLTPGAPLDRTGDSTPWELSGTLSPLGLGAPHTLLLTLDNALFAGAEGGGLAFIQKTYAGFRVLTRPAAVPEPASLALLLAGMLAALLVRKNRRQAAQIHNDTP
jgi:hypothetical protein